jgi:hypothetical protein
MSSSMIATVVISFGNALWGPQFQRFCRVFVPLLSGARPERRTKVPREFFAERVWFLMRQGVLSTSGTVASMRHFDPSRAKSVG